MQRVRLESTAIVAVAYDRLQQVLQVEFPNGAFCVYVGVPEAEYQGLISAQSHGTYFDQRIKGQYGYRRTVEPRPT